MTAAERETVVSFSYTFYSVEALLLPEKFDDSSLEGAYSHQGIFNIVVFATERSSGHYVNSSIFHQ